VDGHAPFRFVSNVGLTITTEQLFALLDDAESWPQWATVITKVTWTSRNRTASAPRTVDMRGGIVGDVGGTPPRKLGVPHPLAGENFWPGNRTATRLFGSTKQLTAALRRSPTSGTPPPDIAPKLCSGTPVLGHCHP